MKKLFHHPLCRNRARASAWGYYQAIYVAPEDAMQGEIFRIIYYHVPSFATAFFGFAVSLAGSIGFLAFRRAIPSARRRPMPGPLPARRSEWCSAPWA